MTGMITFMIIVAFFIGVVAGLKLAAYIERRMGQP